MSDDTIIEHEEKSEAEQKREADAAAQGLPEGSVPEQRPQAANQPDVEAQKGEVRRKLEEAGDPRADDEPMDQEAYDKANSSAQRKKAAKAERREVLRPGTHARVVNEGEPDHGRLVAVNRVDEWASIEDERIAAAGTPESRFAEVKVYECRSRDGRHELLMVDAEHLVRIENISNATVNPT